MYPPLPRVFSLTKIILTTLFALSLLLASCGNGTTGTKGGDVPPQTVAYFGEAADGTMYTLTITEKTARYAAKTGDAYELTAGSKKSTGTVSGKSGDTLTLSPSRAPNDTFTATVDDTGIKGMDKTITWDKNTDGTTTAPSTLTPKGSGVPKTIKITGYTGSSGSHKITTIWPINIFTESAGVDNWAPTAESEMPKVDGETLTFEMLNEMAWMNKGSWTGTGKFYIMFQCAPARNDSSKDRANYVYSLDGSTPALYDIKDAVTTLEWSKFIWRNDYTGG